MDVMLVFDAVVALFGAYMIGSALHMKKSGRINSMVLAQEELKKVKDTKGYVVWCAGVDRWFSWSLK